MLICKMSHSTTIEIDLIKWLFVDQNHNKIVSQAKCLQIQNFFKVFYLFILFLRANKFQKESPLIQNPITDGPLLMMD